MRLPQTARRKAGLEPEENHRVNTGEFEWYTPARYLDAVGSDLPGA